MSKQVGLVIMGKMASGKTEASNYLVKKYNATAWTVAERIKQVSHALIDQTGNLDDLLEVVIVDSEMRKKAAFELLKFADKYILEDGKPRELYQEVGQIMRDLNPKTRFCWEEDLYRRMEAAKGNFQVVDVRSKEGYNFFVLQRDFVPVRIDAPLEVRKSRLLERDNFAMRDENLFYHQSETDVDTLDFQFVIDNSQNDPQTLYENLDKIYQLVANPTPALFSNL